jgi:hypothetical protein
MFLVSFIYRVLYFHRALRCFSPRSIVMAERLPPWRTSHAKRQRPERADLIMSLAPPPRPAKSSSAPFEEFCDSEDEGIFAKSPVYEVDDDESEPEVELQLAQTPKAGTYVGYGGAKPSTKASLLAKEANLCLSAIPKTPPKAVPMSPLTLPPPIKPLPRLQQQPKHSPHTLDDCAPFHEKSALLSPKQPNHPPPARLRTPLQNPIKVPPPIAVAPNVADMTAAVLNVVAGELSTTIKKVVRQELDQACIFR